jgi:uncharacterized protein
VPSTPITFHTPAGLALEGRLAGPDGTARGVAVLCHPHPVYGGTMATSVIPTLQRALVSRGWLALRFNFRGAGASEGSYDGGRGEVDDARAALDHVVGLAPDVPVAMLGWSFGALVALRAAVADPRVETYVAGGPPVSVPAKIELPVVPDPTALAGFTARVLGICGTEDEFCHPNDLAQFIASISPTGRTHIAEGADHLFTDHRLRKAMGETVADFVAGA